MIVRNRGGTGGWWRQWNEDFGTELTKEDAVRIARKTRSTEEMKLITKRKELRTGKKIRSKWDKLIPYRQLNERLTDERQELA